MRTLVVVIGDLGRSPRMLAHIGAMLRSGHDVHAVGGTHTALPRALADNPRLRIHPIALGAAGRGAGVRAAFATAWRGIRLTWRLARVMMREVPAPDVILVQNPPSLPTLPVALAAARWRGSTLIVDWHNLGWTILALRFGARHPLVRAAAWAELCFGRLADAHLCVSGRLATHLQANGVAQPLVLRDGPSRARALPVSREAPPSDPITIVAPMGWSRDDDLALLEAALVDVSLRIAAEPERRHALRVLVSGHGPQRAEWAPRLRALSTAFLLVETPDVPAEEYAALLASSHIGLSVHRSSSGMDLPMKVIELRAVGVPAFVLEDGAPLDEIAPAGCGVRRYRDAAELAALLYETIRADASAPNSVAGLRAEARAHPPESWDDNWDRSFARILPSAVLLRSDGRSQ